MLLSLHIENIAVIKRVDFDFSEGFMALTGETGAGKSIVIDSINLLLGARAERELVRTGAERAIVSGLFGDLSTGVCEALAQHGVYPDEDGSLLLQRTLASDGKTKITVNGRAVGISVLRAIAPYLVSIHAQSDTSSLADAKNHLELLDVYAGVDELLSRYRISYTKLEKIRKRISDINDSARESERLREILEYQIKDIDAASLTEGEEEELVDKKVKLKNSEKITKNSEFVYKALKGSEKGGVSYLLDRSITALGQLSTVIPEFSEYAERLRDCLYQIDDVAESVYDAVDGIDEDPTEALNKIESRLDKISKLKRKYGLTVADILAFREKSARELSEIENAEELLEELSREERAAYKEALLLAEELHSQRISAVKTLEERVKETLEFLDMPKVVFFASVREELDGEDKKLTRDGLDEVEFYISANRGAEPQPLSKIASGGELSRIMLALKSVIADKDGIPTVIYDEIDAGVSGKTARKIGIKMLELSRSAQLFSVTHSAQIASLADTHFLISKGEVDGAAETSVRVLDEEGRVSELARILGGIDVTESQRAAAMDMLSERLIYK